MLVFRLYLDISAFYRRMRYRTKVTFDRSQSIANSVSASNMGDKGIWSVSDIIDNRNNWSLAADAELLRHLQRLSQVIFT